MAVFEAWRFGKNVEASGRHYNGFVVAIIAARAPASAYSAPNGTDASTTHSLIGYANARPYADPEKAARRILEIANAV
jgi:hypothetical protein